MTIHPQPVTGFTNTRSPTSSTSADYTSANSDSSSPFKNNGLLQEPDLTLSDIDIERSPSSPTTTDSEQSWLATTLSFLFPGAAGRIARLNPNWHSNPVEHPPYTAAPFHQFPHAMFDYYHTLPTEQQVEIRRMESGKPPNVCQRCLVDSDCSPP